MFTLLLCGFSQAAYDAQLPDDFLINDLVTFLSLAVFFAIPIGTLVSWWKDVVTDMTPSRRQPVMLGLLDYPAPVYSVHEEPGP